MHKRLVVHLNVKVWSFHAIESLRKLLDYNAGTYETVKGDPSITPLRAVSWRVSLGQRETQDDNNYYPTVFTFYEVNQSRRKVVAKLAECVC